jgi:hypothetical protein
MAAPLARSYGALTLSYFDAQGSAEATRLTFSIGAVPFTDRRVSREDWAALKPATPYGELPVRQAARSDAKSNVHAMRCDAGARTADARVCACGGAQMLEAEDKGVLAQSHAILRRVQPCARFCLLRIGACCALTRCCAASRGGSPGCIPSATRGWRRSATRRWPPSTTSASRAMRRTCLGRGLAARQTALMRARTRSARDGHVDRVSEKLRALDVRLAVLLLCLRPSVRSFVSHSAAIAR